MKKDDEIGLWLSETIRDYWWSRPGHEAIGKVLRTFDALNFKTQTGLKPKLSHYKKTPTGWHLIFVMPPGIASADIIAKVNHFREQTGGSINMKAQGASLHMDLFTEEIPTLVPFLWDPSPYLKMALPMPVGHTAAGLMVIDLAAIPHAFVAGLTGGGKTAALRAIVTALLHLSNVQVCIIDLKRLDFGMFRKHALVASKPKDASRVLQALNDEMDRRIDILDAAEVTKLQNYKGGDLSYIVAVIDELTELTEKRDQENLERLAHMSRASGISLIAATQRPSATTYKNFTDTRAQFAGRLCFFMASDIDSRMVLESDSAAKLPAHIKGRAIWKWDGEQEVQCMFMDENRTREILKTLPPMAQGVSIFEPNSARLLPR